MTRPAPTAATSPPRLRDGALGAMRGYARRRDDRRGYTTPAGVLPSVTTVLGATSAGKARLEQWLKRPDAAQISETARRRGTWTHAQIEAWIRGDAPLTRHFAFGAYARNVIPWLEAHFTEALAIEEAVWHPSGFSGTFDALGYATYGSAPSALTLFDWKTSAKPRDGALLEDYFCQLGAYTAGLEHTWGVRPERALLVIARPTPDGPDVWELPTADLAHYEAEFSRRLQRYYAPPA
jgi:hypothetical protein